MNHSAHCNQAFTPCQPYHPLGDDCLRGWDRQPRRRKGVSWHPRWDRMLGDRPVIWALTGKGKTRLANPITTSTGRLPNVW